MTSFYRRTACLAAVVAFSSVIHAQTVPAEVQAAITAARASADAIVRIPANRRSFENTIGALDDLAVRLDTATSLPIFLQNVSTDATVRDNARAAEEAVTAFTVELGKREDLYLAVKAFAATNPALVGEPRRLLDFILRDYRRAGMDQPKAVRDRLAEIEITLQKQAQDFERAIAEDETALWLTPEDLKGLDREIIASLPHANGLVLVKMDGPTFNAIIEQAEKEDTRKKVWYAYKRRGGEKNARLLEKALKLRAEQARLLGFKNFVDYVAEPRMAKDSATIAKFYAELRPIVRKKAALDLSEFVAMKRTLTRSRTTQLFPWDQPYIKAQILQRKFRVDNAKIAEYFPVNRVFDGLFQVASNLYDIEFKDVTADATSLGLPVWHPDVRLFAVSDKSTGKPIGHIYTDLFPRENKYNHAACWGLRSRKVWTDGTVQLPLAALVCNFTKPTADKPALMTHDEVETFFHEFGHGLHNLLTQTSSGRFSGTNVEIDFVEAPSQMFENWTWEPEVLRRFARHYKTNEVLPDTLIKNLQAAQTVGSGLETEHQLYYGLVDQAYHVTADGTVDTTRVGIDLMPQIEQYPKPEGTFFQSSFGHLMGGYEGAYYGYQWSLVYAQDMYERFLQFGILSPKAGAYYREKILSRGGSADASELLRDYLGREPKLDAYLKHLGISPR